MFALCSSSPSPPPLFGQRSVTEIRFHLLTPSVSVPSISEVSGCETCFCGRRRFIGASATLLVPIRPSYAAANSTSGYKDVLDRIRPPKPDWYEEMFAVAMKTSMKPYEAEIASYKTRLFAELNGKATEVLELGIGTGPNLKYYAGAGGFAARFHVIGVDPNVKMEKYAKEAAITAGMPFENFDFRQAVGEALPLADASVDVVIGTLVLCSVGDIRRTLSGISVDSLVKLPAEVMRVLKPGGLYLFIEHVAAKDGTFLRVAQSLLEPLQQVLADGCHLTRNTGQSISEAGFSRIDINSIFLGNASLLGPHVYGVAQK